MPTRARFAGPDLLYVQVLFFKAASSDSPWIEEERHQIEVSGECILLAAWPGFSAVWQLTADDGA